MKKHKVVVQTHWKQVAKDIIYLHMKLYCAKPPG